jgi:16S rRNA (cytidine1402-2'-O)-methyltransferase
VIGSGLATDSIFFGGFLPSKKSERLKRLAEIANIPATLVLYETPHRLGKSLADCLEVLGDRQAAIARELTKLHEEFARGSLRDLLERFGKEPTKGEIVLVIDRLQARAITQDVSGPKSLAKRLAELEKEGIDPKTALKKAAKEFGLSKSEAYRMTQLKGQK